MTTADEPGASLEALRALVQEHRRLLEELETRLEEQTSAQATPTRTAGSTVRRQDVRMARNEVRRAARRIRRGTVPAFWVAVPESAQSAVREIAAAREQVGRRMQDYMAAMDSGKQEAARQALEEIVFTERAIQVAVEDMPLPSLWSQLTDDLLRASDALIDAARTALSTGPGADASTTVQTMMAGQGAWIGAWRTFVQVVPSRVDL